MEYDVFLSYLNKDVDFANNVFLFLEREGIHCCFLRKDKISEVDYKREAVCKIKESKLMVLLCSSYPSFNLSIFEEIALAHHENKKIIPFLVNGVNLGWYLSNMQYLSLSDRKLTTSLTNILVKNIRKIIHDLEPKVNPWQNIEERYLVGSIHTGKVEGISNFGVFVRLERGVQGMISLNNLSWNKRGINPFELVKKGDFIQTVILKIELSKKRIELGYKQLKPNPWETIDIKYPIGSKHTAKVRNFTNYGIFVEMEDGVNGMIHISNLSWTKKVKHPSEFTQKGSYMDVVVLEIDKEKQRLELGHKQLKDNPWDTYERVYTLGTIHLGKIIEIMKKGGVVALNEGGEGFSTPKHLMKEDGTMAQLGEELPFLIVEFVKEKKRIILSHRRTYEEKNSVKNS